MVGKQANPGSPDMTLELSGSQPRVASAPGGHLATPEYIFWVLHQGGAGAPGLLRVEVKGVPECLRMHMIAPTAKEGPAPGVHVVQGEKP